MNLTALLELLQEAGIKPKKSLSQNFLIDQNITRKICRVADVKKGDLVIEIGPGPGALTSALIETGADIIVIEKDQFFAKRLSTIYPNIEVHEADALSIDLETLLKNRLQKGQKAKVVSNLPYNITTPILIKLFSLHKYFSSITCMVQKEVAMRFVAKEKTKEYGAITLFLQLYSIGKIAIHVPASCFFPKPRVDSAVVHFVMHEPKIQETEKFHSFVRKLFSTRRKMISTSLKEDIPLEIVQKALTDCRLELTARIEELPLEKILQLFGCLKKDLQ